MSLCIRNISNKLTPFVGTRKPITHLDFQLPKHVKESSAFLQKFLAAGVTTNRNPELEILSLHHLKLESSGSLKNLVAWNYKLKRGGNTYFGRNKKDSAKYLNSFADGVCTEKGKNTVFSIGESGSSQLEQKPNEEIQQSPDGEQGRPTAEQLNHVYETLKKDLPEFFFKSVDFSIYHTMIVFENNIKGTIKSGLGNYVTEMAMLRIIGHVKFAYIKFDVLKITINPEDDSIKVRWRIRGLKGYKILLTFWKYKVWKLQPILDSLESWYDGFSTFYVDGNGKVVRHVADKMMPDQDVQTSEKEKNDMAAKLALFVGLLAPRDFLSDALPFIAKSIRLKRDKHC